MDKNAYLSIRNSRKFESDIWQYGVGDAPNFNEGQWKSVINNFAETLQSIYNDISDGKEVDESDLYVLGDVVNMLFSIDVIKESNV